MEPRRIAAKLSALRVAKELGEKVGGRVGYHFRFEKAYGPDTRLLFLTEGMLVRRLLLDPTLSKVGTIILDEFHERSLATDIAIGMSARLRTGSRPDLRIVVMSATIDTEKVSRFLGDCPMIQVEAPRFPVEMEYTDLKRDQRLEETIKHAVRRTMTKLPEGDVLVFLPGMREIRRAEEQLGELKKSIPFETYPLHGELSPDEQEAALSPQKKRKVILSTNIAETSVTIEGVRAVIDSGLQRSASHSYWSGMTTLSTKAVSKASAIQRAGRAGRLGPGLCVRLYSQNEFDSRPPYETPEIARTDLSQTCLELIQLGNQEPKQFPWFDAPPGNSLEASLQLLERLQAIERTSDGYRITAHGKKMVGLPLHPRLGRFLIEAEAMGLAGPGIRLAAMIQTGEYPGLDILEWVMNGLRQPSRTLQRIEDQLRSNFPPSNNSGQLGDLGRALLAGFPDRVAQVRAAASGQKELLLAEGGTARVQDDHLKEGEFVVLVEASETKNERSQVNRYAQALARIEPEWILEIPGNPTASKVEAQWDEKRGRPTAYELLTYGQLVLDRVEIPTSEDPVFQKVIVDKIFQIPFEQWKALEIEPFLNIVAKYMEREDAESILARAFLILGDKNRWPEIRERWQQIVLSSQTAGEFKSRHWTEDLLAALPNDTRARLDNLTPMNLSLPSGRKAKIHYRLDRPPWVESRLQDFFGMKEVPQILGGKLPLTAHLLAPNYRAVQVTKDVAGFWEREYPRVRKELQRQYPRHAWPENPLIPIPEKARTRR